MKPANAEVTDTSSHSTRTILRSSQATRSIEFVDLDLHPPRRCLLSAKGGDDHKLAGLNMPDDMVVEVSEPDGSPLREV